MASIASPIRTTNVSERRFFLWLSLAIAAAVFAGFGRGFALGRVSWAELPLQVHLHAIVFSAWIVLYVVQNALVVRGSLALHRRLGGIGAVLAAAMVPLGIVATVMALRRGAVPGFFPPSIFLVMNVLGMLAFASLIAAGIALRARSDWHRRLMACGTIVIMVPGIARLLPMALFGAFAPLAVTASMLVYVAAGMAFDRVARRRVHRAWWVGAGVILAVQLAIGPIAFSPPMRTLAARLVAAPPAQTSNRHLRDGEAAADGRPFRTRIDAATGHFAGDGSLGGLVATYAGLFAFVEAQRGPLEKRP